MSLFRRSAPLPLCNRISQDGSHCKGTCSKFKFNISVVLFCVRTSEVVCVLERAPDCRLENSQSHLRQRRLEAESRPRVVHASAGVS